MKNLKEKLKKERKKDCHSGKRVHPLRKDAETFNLNLTLTLMQQKERKQDLFQMKMKASK